MYYKGFLKRVSSFLVLTILGHSSIVGVAFKDYNADGIKQEGEPGVSGIIIKVYDSSDSYLTETKTNSDGNYTLDITPPVRLEFKIPKGSEAKKMLDAKYDYPSAKADVYGSSIQFVNSQNEEHNFALAYPYDISTDENPYVFTSILVNGYANESEGDVANKPAIVKFHFEAKGAAANSGKTQEPQGEAWIEVAKQKQVGSIHGIAYSRVANKIFASALVKRHSGLGPLGAGGVYILNPDKNSTNQESVEFLNLDEIGIPTSDTTKAYTTALIEGDTSTDADDRVAKSNVIGTNIERGLSTSVSEPSNDPAAYGQVGKLGIGDIDISDNGKYLYLVNLYDRKLYQVDLSDAKNPTAPTAANKDSKVKSFDILNECQDSNYPKAGEYRPFGIKYYRGKVYVGVVCSGQDSNDTTIANSASDLKAYIVSIDTNSTNTQKEIEWNLNYRDTDGSTKYEPNAKWNPWSNSWYDDANGKIHPIPIVGDIEFDNRGNMLIAMMDIHTHMAGYINYGLTNDSRHSFELSGDLIRATYDITKDSYSMDLTTEFYHDDLAHYETTAGALAGHHTSTTDRVLVTMMDPVNRDMTYINGAILLNNIDGKQRDEDAPNDVARGYGVVDEDTGHMGKANALGDLESIDLLPPLEIGNRVWLDSNANGIQDAGESGIEGVKLILSQGSDCLNEIANTTTNSKGEYLFNHTNVANLQPNTTYSICIDSSQFINNKTVDLTPLNKLVLTKKDALSSSDTPDKTDSDAKADNYALITLNSANVGENNHSYDFGFKNKTYCLGDKVWLDSNKNGIQDSNEDNFTKSVTVKLLDSNGTIAKDANKDEVAAITTTNGSYKFCNLLEGSYKIEVDIPSDYIITSQNQGIDDSIDSDINKTTKQSDIVDLKDDNLDVDIGLQEKEKTYCLGDFVWEDKNKNGIQDTNEDGIKGVKITLNETNATTLTNRNGYYEFCGLVDGNYSIKIDKKDLPKGYLFTNKNIGADDSLDSDVDSNGNSQTITIKDANNTTLDIGLIKETYCIGDLVWEDKNKDGIQNSNEDAVEGVKVILEQNSSKTAVTNSNGEYKICGLENGDYSVIFEIPSGYLVTTKNATTNDEIDSDVDINGKSDIVTIKNDNNLTLDLGIYKEPKTYCLGDLIWEDSNNNGVQDSNEKGLKGVKVILNETNATTTTNSEGKYEFCGLVNGDYSITVDKSTLPKGYLITKKAQGSDTTKDSNLNEDGSSDVVTIKDSNNTTLDGGVYKKLHPAIDIEKATNNKDADNKEDAYKAKQDENITWSYLVKNIGDEPLKDIKVKDNKEGNVECPKTTLDINESMSCTPKYSKAIYVNYENNATVEAKGLQTDTLVKDSDLSHYTIAKVGSDSKVKVCIGDFVWEDVNKDGIQNIEENGVSGVEIILYNKNGVEINRTKTDINGKYQFCNLDKNSTYKIKFVKPNGYKETLQNQGEQESVDSDIDENGEVVIDTNSTDNLSVDAGYYKLDRPKDICLGDYVWYDENLNGIQDEDKGLGVVDIKVHLYYADGEIAKDINGKDIKATKTDKSGHYKFCNLKPGIDYKIKFEIPNTYHATIKDTGNLDTKDSDANKEGIIFVNNPMSDDLSFDLGIYCDCDEYKLESNSKKSSASAFNFFGVLSTIFILLFANFRRKKF